MRTKKIFMLLAVGLLCGTSFGQWGFSGNSITSGEWLGSTNAQALVVKTNNSTRMTIASTGEVGIGIAPTAFVQLGVEGFASKFSSGTGSIVFTHNSAQIDLLSTSVPTIDFRST